jgi:hypothetical protein
VKMCTALANQNLTGINFLSTEALDAKVLWI